MSLTVDDLLKKCVVCGGSGEDPDKGKVTRGFTRTVVVLPAPPAGKCPTCRGEGYYELTEAGEAIVKLMKVHDMKYGRA